MAVNFAEQKIFWTSLGLFASKIFLRSYQKLMLDQKLLKLENMQITVILYDKLCNMS